MLRKVKGGYKLRSQSGKMLGRKGGKAFKSKEEAMERERQIQYFKHKGKK